MEKNTEQLTSEVWDSMNYTMPDTGYIDRARANGVIGANGGELPQLSFRNVIDKLKPYIVFDSIKGAGGLEDSYAVGRSKNSQILVEVIYEVESDLTKRLDEQEESELAKILGGSDQYHDGFRFIEVSDENRGKLIELGGWSIPLITTKITYNKEDPQEILELVRHTLLCSGLEKV